MQNIKLVDLGHTTLQVYNYRLSYVSFQLSLKGYPSNLLTNYHNFLQYLVCNMELSHKVCKDNGLDTGYNTFVLPDFQHACDSNEYEKAINEPRIKTILNSKALDKLPCCNVLDTSKNISRYHLEHIEHIKKDKGPEHILEEARKSFMSGHSSFSFYCATFLVIYLQVRLSNDQVQDCKLRKEGNIVSRTLLRYFSL